MINDSHWQTWLGHELIESDRIYETSRLPLLFWSEQNTERSGNNKLHMQPILKIANALMNK